MSRNNLIESRESFTYDLTSSPFSLFISKKVISNKFKKKSPNGFSDGASSKLGSWKVKMLQHPLPPPPAIEHPLKKRQKQTANLSRAEEQQKWWQWQREPWKRADNRRTFTLPKAQILKRPRINISARRGTTACSRLRGCGAAFLHSFMCKQEFINTSQ